jgi:hypothetical protein
MTPGDEQNRRKPDPCDLCGNTGRWYGSDSPCTCEAGRPYYASLPPDPEAMRLARELAVMLA